MERNLVSWLMLGLCARNTGCLNTIFTFSPLSGPEFPCLADHPVLLPGMMNAMGLALFLFCAFTGG